MGNILIFNKKILTQERILKAIDVSDKFDKAFAKGVENGSRGSLFS